MPKMKLTEHNPTLDRLVLAAALLKTGYPKASSEQLAAAVTTPTFNSDLKSMEKALRKIHAESEEKTIEEEEEIEEEEAKGKGKKVKAKAKAKKEEAKSKSKKSKDKGKKEKASAEKDMSVAELVASNLAALSK